MGSNARNSHKDVAKAGKVSAAPQLRPRGDSKESVAHDKMMKKLNLENDEKLK